MIGWVAGLLMTGGRSEQAARAIAKIALIALAAAAVIGAVIFYLGQRDAATIERHEDKIQLGIERGARTADQGIVDRQAERQVKAVEARKEFNDATKGLPPARLTDRQRVDLCRELHDAGTDTSLIPQCVDLSSGGKTGP